MNRSERDSNPAEAVDIENVMQEVRRQILERQLPGQVLLPETTSTLPPEYYEHLFRAGMAQSRLEVKMLVTESRVPLFGPLIDRLRTKIHELVVFYINRFADNQARVNNHMIQALSVLGRSEEGGDTAYRNPLVPVRHVTTSGGEWATAEDVLACYRLLLDREPDPDGWDYWLNLVNAHPISRTYLVDSFLNSQEFKEVQAKRSQPVLVELDGFKMYVRLSDAFIGATIARDKAYEPHVSRVLSKHLSRGKTFVDVGANIGYFSLLAAAQIGLDGRVIAFEPNPANCDLLSQSIAANGFEKLIDLHPFAAAEARQTFYYSTSGIDSNGQIVISADAPPGVVLPTVEAVTLDEFLAAQKRVDVIKLDVEGAEARVWRGMQNIVRQHRPVLIFEFSPGLLRQTSQVDPVAFLEEVHALYDLYIIPPDGRLASKPDSISAIMERHGESGLSHLDIFASPKRHN